MNTAFVDHVPVSFRNRTYTFKDIAGQRFGRWSAIRPLQSNKHNSVMWECVCECGTIKAITGTSLRQGRSLSCGCFGSDLLSKRLTKHGRSRSKAYRVWAGMKGRCNNKAKARYCDYGGRGISYDPRWESFENFYADMGDVPEGMQIDRIDNDGNYTKQNCRWVTPAENLRNTRRTRIIELDGQKLTVKEASEACGIADSTLRQRLNAGWPTALATTKAPCKGERPFGSRKGRGKSNFTKLQERINTLFDAIKHGSPEHQDWLRTAINNHFRGLPVPPVRP